MTASCDMAGTRAQGRAGGAMPALPLLRRKCACGNHADGGECADCARSRLQRKPAGQAAAPAAPVAVGRVIASPGRPLDGATRGLMEARFGRDFSGVRVHTDAEAARSADAVSALAYTVGPHVVFAAGRYAPGAAPGRQLLAHELTHVVQQAAPAGAGSVARDEAEADRVADAFAAGRALPAIGGGGRGLRKQDAPKATDGVAEAARAELLCDLREMCRLHFAHPQTVDTARVIAAYRNCAPSALARAPGLDPCPSIAALPPKIPGPLPTPSTAGPATGSAGAGGTGGLHLPSTKLKFHLGDLQGELNLPSSLTASLPVRYRGAQVLGFKLDASASGNFSLTVTIDAVPHVRISLKAGVSVGKQPQASAGLVIEATDTVCRAEDPQTAKDKLEKAGKKLHDAIEAAQKSAQADKLADVVAAIAAVQSEIDAAKAKCKQVPRAKLEFGAHTPLGPFSPHVPPTEGDRGAAPYVGGTLTIPF